MGAVAKSSEQTQSLRGQSARDECPSGTFQPDSGATQCLPCETGTFSPQGATSCSNPVPTMSFLALGLAILTLIGVGAFGLGRLRS
jgi:hypothetical protein